MKKDLLIEDISKDQRYQNDINSVEPISLPSGKSLALNPRSMAAQRNIQPTPAVPDVRSKMQIFSVSSTHHIKHSLIKNLASNIWKRIIWSQ
jgi:hypothetical protein